MQVKPNSKNASLYSRFAIIRVITILPYALQLDHSTINNKTKFVSKMLVFTFHCYSQHNTQKRVFDSLLNLRARKAMACVLPTPPRRESLRTGIGRHFRKAIREER
ncbi:hypothetical protein TNCT_662721 [Trichonephila clavata]|uniref:Uncharacterized protein n=1 Tax=Trichonephila clavata TaxID=2740835 RepID=A0A8X6KUA1_TRICU|nr:hypothetical protein TNCT_662721 [Trichonephila clavata]